MPDFKTQILKALNNLDDDVIALIGNFVKSRKRHYENAVRKLHNELKTDVERYGVMLLEGNITKDEFEMLVRSRTGVLKAQVLEEVAISKKKFEAIAVEVAKLAIKAVLLLL